MSMKIDAVGKWFAETIKKRVAEVRDPVTNKVRVITKDDKGADEYLFPGGWISDPKYRFDFFDWVNSVLWYITPTVLDIKSITLNLVLIWSLALAVWICTILFSLAFPLALVYIIWATFGTSIVMWGLTLTICCFAIFVIGIKVLLYYLWMPVITNVVEGFISAYPHLESRFRDFCLTIANGVKTDYMIRKGLQITDTIATINGADVSLAEIEMYLITDSTLVAEIFSVLTYLHYGPKPHSLWREILSISLVCFLFFASSLIDRIKRILSRGFYMAKICLMLSVLAVSLDIDVVSPLLFAVKSFVFATYLTLRFIKKKGNWKVFRSAARLYFLLFVLRAFRTLAAVKLIFHRHRGNAKSFNKSMSRIRAVFNQSMMDIAHVIDQVALPDFIRTVRDRLDVEAIQDSQQILTDLGWPKSVDVSAPRENIADEKFKNFNFASFDFQAGVPHARFYVEKELNDLREIAPMYMNSFQYATWENELDTTARYFKEVDYKYPDLGVDEAWHLLWPIFKNSRLTPFKYIVSKWEKRYGLGPFWKDADRRKPRKLPRFKAIKMMGGFANFVQIWAKTFFYSPHIVPTAGVSVKGEALPPKKWMANKVRTIISSPLSHYILSTVWNYGPNHNFQYWNTPIKVGMPLNGANLSKLFEEHHVYTNHFAGDFTDFDSTIQTKVLDLVKEIRKKGFEQHKDYRKICHLIDINYSGLYNGMPLAFTSTGNIYDKKQGMSTGHSSTSMDNSVALVVLYLMIWKDLTGLSAHQFRHFCKLSNYGDDHILSWLSTAPAVWTKSNMIKCAARWGLQLRDESPNARGVEQMEFLSKIARQPTAKDRAELQAAGVKVPTLIVAHNPMKLLGKATAPIKNASFEYRLKRMVSYLDLCAHHKDLYDNLSAHAKFLNSKVKNKKVIPTYEDVLNKWYNPKSVIKMDLDISVEDDTSQDDVILSYGNESILDQILSGLSIVPDLLNPVLYNQGYVDWIISRLGNRMAWPIHLLRIANQTNTIAHLQAIGRRTPYEWLVVNPHVYKYSVDVSPGGLLLRHWLFLLFKWPDNLTPRLIVMIRSLTKKLSDLNFAISGNVWVDTYRSGVPFWDMTLILLLSFLPDFPALGFLIHFKIPNPLDIMEQVYQALLAQLWHSVPPNFKELHVHMRKFVEDRKTLLIQAPTGTGKSTVMVKYIVDHTSDTFNNYIVVSPRTIIAEMTAPYVAASFGLDALAVTSSSPFVRKSKVIYATPVEVYLHTGWVDTNTLIMIDECHLNEALVVSMIKWCSKMNVAHLLTSATPSEENIKMCSKHLKLRMASVWTKTEVRSATLIADEDQKFLTYNKWFREYLKFIREIVLTTPNRTRFLIFVPSVHHCTQVVESIGRPGCILNSQNKVVDPEARLYVATSVADVGLTLPNVDWVITSNITKESSMINNQSRVVNSYTTPALLQQRAGRVGRNSNGWYSIFTMDKKLGNPEWVVETLENGITNIGRQLLIAGVPIAQIGVIAPEFLGSIMSVDHTDRKNDGLIDKFVQNLEHWQGFNHFHKWKTASGYEKSMAGITHEDLPEVEGEIIHDAPDVIFGGGPVSGIDTKPLTLNAWIDFMLEASKETSVRDYVIKAEDVVRFIKANPINVGVFVRKLKELNELGANVPIYHFGSSSSATTDQPYVSAQTPEETIRRWSDTPEEAVKLTGKGGMKTPKAKKTIHSFFNPKVPKSSKGA